jgi:hypothetical protein
VSELRDWRINPKCDVERVVPGSCLMACPHPGVRRRLLVGGVRKPRGEAQAAARSIGAATGEGKAGRVESVGINRHGEVVNANAGGRTDW